ncbi:DUF6221 family protein [Streptomyces sp. NPDC001286]
MGTVTDLADFLGARWDEAETDSALFHELDCPGPGMGQTEGGSCACPCPAQIHARITTHRRILAICDQHIRDEQHYRCWPVESMRAFAVMKALALPYELHPAWQDHWYPGHRPPTKARPDSSGRGGAIGTDAITSGQMTGCGGHHLSRERPLAQQRHHQAPLTIHGWHSGRMHAVPAPAGQPQHGVDVFLRCGHKGRK